jgi:hypothetical protein
VNCVALGLRGDHRLRHPAQKLPCFGRCPPKIRNISEIAELTKLQHIQVSLRSICTHGHKTYDPTDQPIRKPPTNNPADLAVPALIPPLSRNVRPPTRTCAESEADPCN